MPSRAGPFTATRPFTVLKPSQPAAAHRSRVYVPRRIETTLPPESSRRTSGVEDEPVLTHDRRVAWIRPTVGGVAEGRGMGDAADRELVGQG